MKKTVPRLAVVFLLIIVSQNLRAQRGTGVPPVVFRESYKGVPPVVFLEHHTGGTPVPRQEHGALVCRPATFAALQPLPEIIYDCPEGISESSDELLKTPARLAALGEVTKELESFKAASWWSANVDELNACELHGKPGKLTTEERSKMRGGEFNYSLFGDQEVRLVLLTDPCYQVGYNGSVGFLLVRHGGRIYITKILEGYYSRIDNSVGLETAIVNGERIIEISTGNSMPPATLNYYYVIDPRTHQAVPKKLFKDGKTFTNECHPP